MIIFNYGNILYSLRYKFEFKYSLDVTKIWFNYATTWDCIKLHQIYSP